jgi:outer membrane protein
MRRVAERGALALMLAAAALPGAAQTAPPAAGQAAVVPATPAPGALTLDLAGTVDLAIERAFAVLQGEAQLESEREQVRLDRAAFGPSLTAAGGPELRWSPDVDASGKVRHSTSFSDGASASAHLTLWNGFLDRANLAGSELSLAASGRDLANIRLTLGFQAASTFLLVHLNRELARADEQNLAAERAQLDRVDAFNEAGRVSLADVLQQRAAVASAEQRLLASRQQAELQLLNLKQLLRLAPEAPLELAPPPAPLLEGRDPAGGTAGRRDPAPLEDKALTERPDVQARRLRIDVSAEDIRAARAGYFPTVSLDGSFGTSYSDRTGNGFFTQAGDASNAGVGLSVSVPVLDRRRTRTAVAQAEIARDRNRLSLAELEQQVRFEIRQSLLDLSTADLQISAAEAQLAAAREALEATEARYETGVATFVEVAQSRNLFVEATAARLQALYGRASSLLQLTQRLGEIPGTSTSPEPAP